MPTTVDKFIDRCYDVVKAKPVYKLGASNLSECDCIGMVKYSLRKNAVSFSTTGTNDTFRTKVTNSRRIKSVSDLKKGDVVFKAKNPGDSGYNLPYKYKPGGSAYNGDLTDYTHIGVVKGVNPLRIIHMTSPTAKTDTAIGKWKYAAEMKAQYVTYSDPFPEPGPEPAPTPSPTPVTTKAVVYAEKGLWVKMRRLPSITCGLYDEVPVGAEVTVTGSQGEWTQINYGKRKGWYMMTRFLKFV